jgi:hypothetical protein
MSLVSVRAWLRCSAAGWWVHRQLVTVCRLVLRASLAQQHQVGAADNVSEMSPLHGVDLVPQIAFSVVAIAGTTG